MQILHGGLQSPREVDGEASSWLGPFWFSCDDIEKELMSNRPFEAIVEEATDVVEVIKEAPVDPIHDEQ